VASNGRSDDRGCWAAAGVTCRVEVALDTRLRYGGMGVTDRVGLLDAVTGRKAAEIRQGSASSVQVVWWWWWWLSSGRRDSRRNQGVEAVRPGSWNASLSYSLSLSLSPSLPLSDLYSLLFSLSLPVHSLLVKWTDRNCAKKATVTDPHLTSANPPGPVLPESFLLSRSLPLFFLPSLPPLATQACIPSIV
jgi:hypothetical protein